MNLSRTIYMNVQLGDIIRLRRAVNLSPLYDHIPDYIPSGQYGQVMGFNDGEDDEPTLYVRFAEPYTHLQEFRIGVDAVDVVSRFSLN